MILLDTHALLWMSAGSDALGPRARGSLASAPLAVSAISFWEVAMLAGKGRIIVEDVGAFRAGVLTAGITEVPIDGAIGIRAVRLEDFHADPTDRLIVATAIQLGATLCTADAKILRWCGPGLTVLDAGA